MSITAETELCLRALTVHESALQAELMAEPSPGLCRKAGELLERSSSGTELILALSDYYGTAADCSEDPTAKAHYAEGARLLRLFAARFACLECRS